MKTPIRLHLTSATLLSGLLLLSLLVTTAQATPPAAPTFTNLFQTIPTPQTNTAYGAGLTATHYTLYWTDNATDEDFYEIELKAGAFAWQHWDYRPANSNFVYYTPDFSTAVAQGATISFRISACKGTLSVDRQTAVNKVPSDPSTVLSVAYDNVAQTAFNAPSNFTITTATGTDNHLLFNWTDNSNKEEEYEVYFKASTDASYPAAPAITFSFGNKTQEVPAGLVPGTTYNWKIRARRATAWAAVSGQLQPTAYEYSPFPATDTNYTMPVLRAPTGLAATAKDEKTVTLAWTDNSQNRTHYFIEWTTSTSGNTFEFNKYITAAATTDVDWYPGVDTRWRVTAVFDTTPIQTSAPSNIAALKLPFGAPTNLQISVAGVDTSLAGTATLTWTDNSSVETGFYVIQRPTLPANGTFSLVKTISTPNTTTTTVPTVEDAGGVSYDYQIIAFYTSGSNTVESAPSNTAIGVTKDRITSRLSIGGTNGTALTAYQITTTNASVRSSWNATGLPAGLTFDSGTGTINGTPTVAGLFDVALSATFADGFTDRKTLKVRLVQPAGSPVASQVIGTRTTGLASLTIPLTSMFTDPDAEDAVRVTSSLGSSFDIILYKSLTPETYANFMTYVNAGEYDGVSFHRVSPGFVLQGGGYKPLTADGPTKYEQIAPHASPTNEPGLQNVVGTVAMARSSGVNSATHDFFVNLGDNRSILDNSNGGFTAFGRVAGNGMTTGVADILAMPGRNDYTVSIRQAGDTTFSDVQPIVDPGLGSGTKWPLNDTTEPSTMDNTKAVTMTVARIPTLTFQVTNNTDNTKASTSITGNNLAITGLADGDTDLTVQATDLDGNTVTQTFTLHVASGFVAASITTPPAPQTVTESTTATFTVVAQGTNVTYQWKKNGANIDLATNASYTINSAQTSDVADYTVVVTNLAGSVTSDPAHLTVRVPVHIGTQPLAQSLNYNQPLALSVAATGDATITYQWKKGSTNIPFATGATYNIAHLAITDDADYSVDVTNPLGTVTSDVVHVTVNHIDTDGDGLYDDEELGLANGSTDPNNADTDGDGFGDGLEVGAGTDPKSATSKPSSATTFFAQRDGAAQLNSISFKRLLGATVPTRSVDVAVADMWFATYELTNKQFAAVLQRAKQDGLISITTELGRRVVRYPQTSGQIVCYLATPTGSVPQSCDIDLDTPASTLAAGRGASFTVPVAKQNVAASGISWYGAYLCTVVLNNAQGYTTKNVPATWSYNAAADGYSIPGYAEWELAGRGISPTFAKPGLAYPTGATAPAATAAYFNQPITVTGPKDVGKYAASRLGLFDLAGNVKEWVFASVDATHAYTRGGSFADSAIQTLNSADESLLLTTISRQVGVRLALKASDRATITTHPAAKFQATNTPLSLSVVATGVPPLSYQWYRNNVAIAGQTNATLTIASPTTANAGNYMVKVFSQGINPVSSNTVPVALVNAKTPPPVTTIAAGKGTSFQALAVGAGTPTQTFSYRWKAGTSNLDADANFSGVTTSKLTMATMLPGHSRVYTCEVSLNGQTALAPVTTDFELLVLQSPRITSVTFGTLVVSSSVDVPIVIDTDPTRKPSSFKITGLPAGLTYNSVTGRITGKPLVNGPFNITIVATNAYGSTLPFPITLLVNALPGGATGTFVGIVARNASATLNNNLGGRFDVTIATNGKYTAKLNLGGVPYLLPGVLDAKDPALAANQSPLGDPYPTSTVILARAGKPSLRLFFKIDLSTLKLVSSTVSEVPAAGGVATATAALDGWRLIWSKTLPANGYQYPRINVSLTPPAGDANLVPQGIGYTTLVTDYNTGTTTLAGKLPDGAAITGSSFLSPAGDVMHFQLLYGNTGSLLGFMKQTVAVGTVTASTPLSWFKKPQAVASTDRIYKAGFDTTLAPVGYPYSAPASGAVFGGLPATALNARLTFTSGGLSLTSPTLPSTVSSLIQDFAINTSQTVLMPIGIVDNPKTVTCKIDKTTGSISGTFVLNDPDPTSTLLAKPNVPRTVYWYGLVIPGSPMTTAGFFTMPKLPNVAAPGPPAVLAHTINTSEILSGKVTLTTPPP